jgi:hypothetical protein
VGGAGALCERATDGLVARYSVYFLYWYKSTNHDAGAAQQHRARCELAGAQVACFTGTKVHILTQVRRSGNAHVQLHQCLLAACLFSAARAHEDADLRLVNSSVST